MNDEHSPSASRRRWFRLNIEWATLLAPSLAAVIGVALGVVVTLATTNHWLLAQSGHSAPALAIDAPGSVPRCATITGEGAEATDWLSLLAVGYSSDSNNTSIATPVHWLSPTRWQARVTVGSASGGGTYRLMAFSLSGDTKQFFASIHGYSYSGDDGYWTFEGVPPGASAVVTTSATRSASGPLPPC